MLIVQQYVEIFHLLFIRHLEIKLDKAFYALKGGCNLRFYFKSIRYSEDIDFDIRTIALHTLLNKINKLLSSITFQQNLKSYGIQIITVSAPKQTETTQRWKLSLQITGLSLPIATKIEFSRRNINNDVKFEAIDNDLIQQYKLYQIIANHYTKEAAFNQKINALINRTETQARDIFDLHLLLNNNVNLTCFDQKFIPDLDIAIDNLESIGYTEFKGQVVAYLMASYQKFYASPNLWSEIKNKVLKTLIDLKNETY